MNRSTIVPSALLFSLMLGACATAHDPPQELVQARAAVRSAELDPDVLASAPVELKKATDSLDRANTLLAKGKSMSEVSSAAYVAERHARTAMAVAQSKRNEEAIKASDADRERVRADINAQTAQSARQQASVAQARADDAEQRASSAQQQTMAAEANAAQAQTRAAVLQRQVDELQAKQTERGLLVTLGDMLFEFGRADIRPAAQPALSKLADFLNRHPERHVLIEGYTDSIGSPSFNEGLSRRRADAVAAALVGLGVASQRLSSVGYGMAYPVASNNTDSNRALNRRVEIYISDGSEPVRQRG